MTLLLVTDLNADDATADNGMKQPRMTCQNKRELANPLPETGVLPKPPTATS